MSNAITFTIYAWIEIGRSAVAKDHWIIFQKWIPRLGWVDKQSNSSPTSEQKYPPTWKVRPVKGAFQGRGSEGLECSFRNLFLHVRRALDWSSVCSIGSPDSLKRPRKRPRKREMHHHSPSSIEASCLSHNKTWPRRSLEAKRLALTGQRWTFHWTTKKINDGNLIPTGFLFRNHQKPSKQLWIDLGYYLALVGGQEATTS